MRAISGPGVLAAAALAVVPRVARADSSDLAWDSPDESTCFAQRYGFMGDREGADTWYEAGPALDPVHAGWAAIDAGCGVSRIALRLDARPLTGAASIETGSVPLRWRVGDDWTAYVRPSATRDAGAAWQLDNSALALARRVRALSSFERLFTADAALLLPTSTLAATRAVGAGVGASFVDAHSDLSRTAVHLTVTADGAYTLDTGRVETGATALLGLEVYPRDWLGIVADAGQRVDRSAGYTLWGSFALRLLGAGVRGPRLGVELAISRDVVAAHDVTSGWISLYALANPRD